MKHSITILNREKEIMRINWDTDTKEVTSEWLGEYHFKIPRTIYPENITWKNVMNWLETRTVPRTRFGIEELLRVKFKLREYNPYLMCKMSHGLSMSDYIWLKFDNEEIDYDSIKIRD